MDADTAPEPAAAAAAVVTAFTSACAPDGVLAGSRRIGLACSGGPDSAALLAAASAALAAPTSADVVMVLHVHHGLQACADDMAAVAVEQALAFGLAATVVRVRPGGTDEASARAARYDALAWLATTYALDAVATGHTADDLAGTFLMNLVRGTGLDGLRGMPASRPLTPAPRTRLVRPLLGVRGAQTRAAVTHWGLRCVDDPANSDPRVARTRINELLDEFERLRPGFVDRIGLTAARLDADAALLDGLAQAAADEVVVESTPAWVAIRSDALAAVPEPLAARIVRQALRPLLGGATPPPAAVAVVLSGRNAPLPGTRLELRREAAGGAAALLVVRDPSVVADPDVVAVRLPDGSGWRAAPLADGDRRPGAARSLRDELARAGVPRRFRDVARTLRAADGTVLGAAVLGGGVPSAGLAPELAPSGFGGTDAVGWRPSMSASWEDPRL